jgi:uncharacterized protein (TIGR03437 family)
MGIPLSMKRYGLFFFLVSLIVTEPVLPRQDPAVCGTHREKRKEQAFLHRQALRFRSKSVVRALSPPAPAGDIGNIAIIDDSDGVVARRNDFSLDRKTLTFQPAANAASYRFQVDADTYDALAASNGSRLDGLADDDARELFLPFPFSFYGAVYQRLFVNSDGNLTFGQPDTATSERSLGRLTAGPPRIAVLFRDLDPSKSGQGVRVLSDSGRFVLTWVEVPEYQDFGVGLLQTFQVRLFPDGRIEFAYAGISTDAAVVGISPGGLKGSTAVVSFALGSTEVFSGTVAEYFIGTEEIDIFAAAQKFYETHDDAYDYLVIFNTLGIKADGNALAYEVTVRNDRTGYGDFRVEDGLEYGSAKRLQAVMNMGPLNQYPQDPNARVGNRGQITGDTTLTILGHEAGHLFLAFASIRDPNDPGARPMLGFQMAHWSFNFDSEASLLEGNRIRDNGPGANPRFTTVATVEGFSPLDQYLMGFRAPGEVSPPDIFLVTNSGNASSRFPQTGVSFNGDRRDIGVQEIIQTEGRRTPDSTVSQRHFRFAFVLVAPKGADPSQADLDKLDTFRKEFETSYHHATGDRADADTSLRRSLTLSTSAAAGVLLGRPIAVSISIGKPADVSLPVLLETQNGAATAPSSVTIPAGATSASFQVTGVRTGVEELAAHPADARYETAYSRIQVLDSPSGLKLELVSGDRQAASPGIPLQAPIVLRVVDVNRLPYQGLTVQAAVSDGGSLTPASATSDRQGLVAFEWIPGSGSAHQLTAAIQSAPSSAVALALAGAPALPAAGVVNGASFVSGLSPGGFASIFGTNLAAGATGVARPPYPFKLADVMVLLDGRAVPLHFVSDSQINFLVPQDMEEGVVNLVVTNPVASSIAIQIPVVAASPGLFFDPYTGFGAIVVHGTSQTTAQRPARRGEDFLEIYATGLGAVRPSVFPGLQETVLSPRVSLGGGAFSLPVLFSGLAPSFPGLYQINVSVPADAPVGEQTLSLEVNGARSNAVKVRIQ